MIKKYMQAALQNARYVILADDGSFYGEIPLCNGVYANALTLEDCRWQLDEVLEEWVLFRLLKNLSLPVIVIFSLLTLKPNKILQKTN
jgi:predicted RNase H-like HicB family nuclease